FFLPSCSRDTAAYEAMERKVPREYRFKDRKVPKYSEKLEMSEAEVAHLRACLELSAKQEPPPATGDPFPPTWIGVAQGDEKEEKGKPTRILFDTDLGTDIDDSLALLTALHLPPEDVELVGITTVYGYTLLRARLCELIVGARDRRVAKGEATR